MELSFHAIAHIENDYKEKFGIPRQSGLVEEVTSRIVFEEAFRNRDAVRGLAEFSHLWLIWVFSEGFSSRKNKPDSDGDPAFVLPSWSPTVRPPRLGGNERLGVWATRSPNRPNPIGLSCVELVSVEPDAPEGPVITVRGADLLDGTPVYDIKPYIRRSDSHPDAVSGFADTVSDHHLEVTDPDGLLYVLSEGKRGELISCLRMDPRPSYQNDPDRIYGLSYAGRNIKFKVSDGILQVIDAS